MNNKITNKTIVFIHGLFQNPDSWSEWKEYFEAKGYRCYAPAYPFHKSSTACLHSLTSFPKSRFLLVIQWVDLLFKNSLN